MDGDADLFDGDDFFNLSADLFQPVLKTIKRE
jgi:hypothetical protein